MSLLSSILRTAPQAVLHASPGPIADVLLAQLTEWQGDLPWGYTLIPDARFSAGLDGRIDALRAHALATHDRLGGLACGSDRIVCATPT